MEARAELIVQGIRIVAHDIEATAFHQPLRPDVLTSFQFCTASSSVGLGIHLYVW